MTSANVALVKRGIETPPMPDTRSAAAAMPDTARPDTAMPDTARPDTARPDTARPDTTGHRPAVPRGDIGGGASVHAA